jgi:hypothetical protein
MIEGCACATSAPTTRRCKWATKFIARTVASGTLSALFTRRWSSNSAEAVRREATFGTATSTLLNRLPHERENTRADRNNSSSDGNADSNAGPSKGDLLRDGEGLNLLRDVLKQLSRLARSLFETRESRLDAGSLILAAAGSRTSTQ